MNFPPVLFTQWICEECGEVVTIMQDSDILLHECDTIRKSLKPVGEDELHYLAQRMPGHKRANQRKY